MPPLGAPLLRPGPPHDCRAAPFSRGPRPDQPKYGPTDGRLPHCIESGIGPSPSPRIIGVPCLAAAAASSFSSSTGTGGVKRRVLVDFVGALRIDRLGAPRSATDIATFTRVMAAWSPQHIGRNRMRLAPCVAPTGQHLQATRYTRRGTDPWFWSLHPPAPPHRTSRTSMSPPRTAGRSVTVRRPVGQEA